MLRTLLLAAILATGIANAQSLPAKFCPSNTNKCSRERPAVTAFCSSYISIKDTTITRTNTVRPTTTITNTRTITAVAATVTGKPTIQYRTITNCVAPVVTPLPQEEPWDPELPEGEPWPERRAVEDNELAARQATSTVRKPTCLYNIGGRSTISAACRCFSIKPTQRTVTATATAARTTVTVSVTKTVRSTRTLSGTTSTTYVFAQPTTFLIANNRGGYAEAECFGEEELVGQARISFDDSSADAILFQLNSDRTLSALEGKPGKVFEVAPPPGEQADISVLSGQPGTDTTKPLTCSITQNADGTCPLACKVNNNNNDVNQGSGMNDWFFGPPNTVTDWTYDIFAVTRQDSDQKGTCQSGRARLANAD